MTDFCTSSQHIARCTPTIDRRVAPMPNLRPLEMAVHSEDSARRVFRARVWGSYVAILVFAAVVVVLCWRMG